MFPSPNVRNISIRPAIAFTYNNGSNDSAAGADGLITCNTTDKLDGFTLSTSVLTCLVPGCYSVKLNFSGLMAAGTAGCFYGYRKNGGATIWLKAINDTVVIPISAEFGIYLKYRDTIEFRQMGGDGATTARTYYPQVLVKQISIFE